MGGNALSSVGAARCSKVVAQQMLSEFRARFAATTARFDIGARIAPIMAYRQKEDFGDLDVLVDSNLFKQLSPAEFVNELSNHYGQPLHWVKNGPVLSIGLPLIEPGRCLQLDLISTPAEEFDFGLQYFSWNDAGNLIGRVAHKMGLKFGHDGLWLPMRDGTNLFDEILVTRDFSAALRFLGFDAERWKSGFDTLDDIYRFIAAGERFDPSLYPLEHRNHAARVRDKKRPVYMGFLRWLEAYPRLPVKEWHADKTSYLPEIFAAFPELGAAHQASLERLRGAKALRARFNGELVSEWTGLQGKELGKFIAHFKREHGDFEGWLHCQSDEQLRIEAQTSYQRFQRLVEGALHADISAQPSP
ncbi:hypothetical protein ACUDPO_34890 (plasmid) [Pseudomonas aeruginosa]|uniref:hypothetical protein n=1 Tax=Pseudomonas aeruginosa TaxID=287 RepID=UPI004046CC8C